MRRSTIHANNQRKLIPKAMDTSFEKSNNTTDEWYTPKGIVDALGAFDLDPCAPINRLWDTAKEHLTKVDNGLAHDWSGKRVWLNPPYSKLLLTQFIEKMVEHNNGIALLFNRSDTDIFHNLIFPNITAIFFIKRRIKFFMPNGLQKYNAGCSSVLLAFNEENARILEESDLQGKFIKL